MPNMKKTLGFFCLLEARPWRAADIQVDACLHTVSRLRVPQTVNDVPFFEVGSDDVSPVCLGEDQRRKGECQTWMHLLANPSRFRRYYSSAYEFELARGDKGT